MLIVTAQVCKMFPFNAWDTAKIVGFLMPFPKRFAWEPIQNPGGMLNRRWVW